MGVYISSQTRQQLKVACRFFGGIKPLAQCIGSNQGNLSRWLNGHTTLSEEKISDFLVALGLAGGTPDTTQVHVWSIKRVAFLDLTPGLSLYFPNGAEICAAPWVNSGFNLRDSFDIGEGLETLYALTDGNVRAILRVPRSLLIQKENIKKLINWKNGTQQKSTLVIPDISEAWRSGVPSIHEFDRAWGGEAPSLSEKDVIEAIREKGISFEEAIAAINAAPNSQKIS